MGGAWEPGEREKRVAAEAFNFPRVVSAALAGSSASDAVDARQWEPGGPTLGFRCGALVRTKEGAFILPGSVLRRV